MNRDDVIMIEKGAREMIEKAARAMAAHTYVQADAWDVWVMDESVRDDYRRKARVALDAAGALPPEPEPEPLPVGTRKRSLGGEEAILTNDGDSVPWMVYKGQPGRVGDWLIDKDVEHWEIITDTPATNDMHVVQDGSDAQDVVSGAPKATIDAESLARWLWNADDPCGEDDETWTERTTREIHAWADEYGHQPPLPKNHAAVMLAGIPDEKLTDMAYAGRRALCGMTAYVAGLAAQAELARRGESA